MPDGTFIDPIISRWILLLTITPIVMIFSFKTLPVPDLPSYRGPRLKHRLSYFWSFGVSLAYFAYLDEFDLIDPYFSKERRTHNDCPVFGLAGIALLLDEVRGLQPDSTSASASC